LNGAAFERGMSLDSDLALFKGIPLFADLPAEQLRLIAFGAVRLELVPGQVLFREGAKAQSGFVVLSGVIQLTSGETMPPKTVATCEAGSLIGEIALLIETRRPATAIATAPSQVLEIERKAILHMLNEYPGVAIRMRERLADRLTATVADLSRIGETLEAFNQPRSRK
jgi:CRP-like cAMP-binding protein